MDGIKNAEQKKEEREQVVELGSDITKSSKGNIYTLTIIGQVEGHQVLPETAKTTKYEHVLPLLAGIEESDEIDGLLLLLNTVGGDIEAGLAIAEMIAGMKKPTVSLVLGGGHSIGIPLAVCTKKSFITPTASMTVHPVRMTGLVVGAPQTFRYFQRIQEQIADFVTANSGITKEQFDLMRDKMDGVIDLATSYSDIFVVIMEILNDVYSILLCKDSLFDVAEREGLLEITEYCYGVIEGDNEPDFSVAEKFVEYEGLQEKIAMMVNAPESALMEICDANKKVIEQLQKGADMKVLERIGLLQSGSVFVTFDADDSKKEEADEKYIKELTDALISDLTKVFEENGRLYNRAVMATVISNLPAYFNNIKEFEEFVHVSLSQCNDEAEQKACMTLINMMMASE